jgi:hypothetical protein
MNRKKRPKTINLEDEYETEPTDKELIEINDFVYKNELLMLTILQELVTIDPNQFIQRNGLQWLLLLFEKNRNDEVFLNGISNCLTTISMFNNNESILKLFIQSGWLRRLNEMVNEMRHSTIDLTDKDKNVKLIRQLTGHRVLFNLKQTRSIQLLLNKKVKTPTESKSVYYTKMLYPLYPLYEEAAEKQRKYILNVIHQFLSIK